MKKKLLILAFAAVFILGFTFTGTEKNNDSITVCSVAGSVLNEF